VILEVPFYKQTTDLNCGPTALKMVFSYFGENYDIGLIEEKVGIKEGKVVSTIQLAIAVARLGFKTKFFSKQLFFDESYKDMDFYKKYSMMDLELSKKLVEQAKTVGVDVHEKSISLDELISFVSQDSVPIVLLDWSMITKSGKGYSGHFVPIVGFEDDDIYVHNQGFSNPIAFLKIRKDIFENARKSEGTDEDTVIVYRKR